MRFLENSGIKLGIKTNKIYNKKHTQHTNTSFRNKSWTKNQ